MNSRLDAQENDDKSVNYYLASTFFTDEKNWPMNRAAKGERVRYSTQRRYEAGEKKEANNERGINLPASLEFAARDEDDIFPL